METKPNLKHGLYARRLAKGEQAALEALPEGSLEAEIHYMRALGARLALILERNGLAHGSTKQLSSGTRRTLAEFDRVMARLLKYITHRALFTGQDAVYESLLEDGKDAARRDLGIIAVHVDPQSSNVASG